MQIISPTERLSDKWLFGSTSLIVVLLLLIIFDTTTTQEPAQVIKEIEYLTNPGDNVDFDTVSSESLSWESVTNPVSLGMHTLPQWFRLSLGADTIPAVDDTLLLEVRYPLLDHLEIWVVDKKTRELVYHFTAGDELPFRQRAVHHESFLFPVVLGANGIDIFVNVQTSGTVKVPMRIWKEQTYLEYTATQNLFMGLFFGLLLAMGINNLFFFLTTRNTTFLYYTGYVLSVALTTASLHGLAYKYIWPDEVWFQGRAVALFASATLFFAVVFSYKLLNIADYHKRLGDVFRAMAWAYAGFVLLSLIMPYALVIQMFLVFVTFSVLIIMGIALWLMFKGISVAGYYALAWTALLASAFSASLDNLNIIHLPVSSNFLLVYGATVEALLLAFILAISYSRQRDEVLDARDTALREEKRAVGAKQELIALQQKAQDELEYKVQERTLELEIALRELSEANRELENLNTIDSLSGIRNRRYFDKRLTSEARRSRREQTPLSVAMIDIDYFKRINDEFGHGAGDQCIIQVSRLLQSALKRPSDDICRYGGEEFGLILPNTDSTGATQLVESMRQMIASTPVEYEGNSITMTLSAGVATAIIEYEEHELALLKQADTMLYKAKNSGRNQIKNH